MYIFIGNGSVRFFILGLLTLSVSILGHANMASPIEDGTWAETGFFSRDVDVLSEVLDITVDKDFRTADYHVTYVIDSTQSLNKMPLVFEVIETVDDFRVQLDGKNVAVQEVQDITEDTEGLYQRYYAPKNQADDTDNYLKFSENAKYFEISSEAGKHTIVVTYRAARSIDKGEAVRRYFFDYSLAPARLWKSFHHLTVNVHFEGDTRYVATNLGHGAIEDAPTRQALNHASRWQSHEMAAQHLKPTRLTADNTWRFERTPQDRLTISQHYVPNAFIRTLIAIPWLVSISMTFLILGALHAWLLYRKRRRQTDSLLWLFWLGSLLIPLVAVFMPIIQVSVTDALLGEYASRYHGYIGLMVVFGYPMFLVLYLLAIGIYNFLVKRHFNNFRRRANHS